MGLAVNDIVFFQGKPAVITSKDLKSGVVTTNPDIETVAQNLEYGMKNGLAEERKEAYRNALASSKSLDKKEEIDKLYEKIKELKKDNADPRVIRYLMADLQHKIAKERYQPKDYAIDVFIATE